MPDRDASPVLRELAVPVDRVVSANAGDALSDVFDRMRANGLSQLPVVADGRVAGIVDESDILLHVYGQPARFGDPVEAAMVRKIDALDLAQPVEALLPLFDRGHVAIVNDGDRFVGLVTRTDLLDWLRHGAGTA